MDRPAIPVGMLLPELRFRSVAWALYVVFGIGPVASVLGNIYLKVGLQTYFL